MLSGRGRGAPAPVKDGPLRQELKRFRCCALFPIPGRGLPAKAQPEPDADKARRHARHSLGTLSRCLSFVQ